MDVPVPWLAQRNPERDLLEQENLDRLNELKNRIGPNMDVRSDDFKNIMFNAFNIYQTYPYNNLRTWRSISTSQNEINQVQVGQIINLYVNGGGFVNWYYFRPNSNNYVIACLPAFDNSNISIHTVMDNPLRIDNRENPNYYENSNDFGIIQNMPQT